MSAKTWAWDTVVRMEKYTGKMFIGNVEVIFDPTLQIYLEKTKKVAKRNGLTDYDLRDGYDNQEYA